MNRKIAKDYESDNANKFITYKEIISEKIRKEVKFHPDVDIKMRFYMEDFAVKRPQCQFMNMPLFVEAFVFYNKNKDYDLKKFKAENITNNIQKIKKRMNTGTSDNDSILVVTFYRYLKFIINNERSISDT